jgi:cytochrome b involved in lipid metabolism
VYNIGPYLPFHPGGEGELLRCAGRSGREVEKMFMEVHPWVNWEGMLGACLVGMLVGEGEGDELVMTGAEGDRGEIRAVERDEGKVTSELDEMD